MKLSDKINRLYELRERKRELNEQTKEIDAEFTKLETQVIQQLHEDNTPKVSSSVATASLSEQTVAQVIDWDAFYQHVLDHSAFYLMERRIANVAFRELHQAGEKVPGLEPYTKVSLKLRKI